MEEAGRQGKPIEQPGTSRRSPLRYLWTPDSRALLALVFVLAIGAIFNADHTFFRIGTHRDTLRESSVYGILACGMTLVIIGGGIDLSVGSVLAFTGVVFAISSIHWGWPAYLSIPLALGAGTACGIISGILVTFFDIQPFIATLAMMVFARGLGKMVSGEMKISTTIQAPDGSFHDLPLPGIFHAIDSRVLGGNLSTVTIIFVVCAIVCWIFLAGHRWGRELYAIGGNEEAARLAGVKVKSVKLFSYAAAGLLTGLAGICEAAQLQQGDPDAGLGYELTAIAIVVVGGTSLMGGKGGMGLTILGMLTIGYLDKILSINAVPEPARMMLTGVIIVMAVLAQGRRKA